MDHRDPMVERSCGKMETEELQSQKGRANIGKSLDFHKTAKIKRED